MGNRDEIDDAELIRQTKDLEDHPGMDLRVCYECGSEFWIEVTGKGVRAKYCPVCRQENPRKRKLEWEARQNESRTSGEDDVYTAVGYIKLKKLPEEDYTDWVGNKIPEFTQSLRMGVFPKGLIVVDQNGNRHIVWGRKLRPMGEK